LSTLEDFVTVNITTISQSPSQVGFGTPLVAGYHTAFLDKVRTYTKLSDLVADGITSSGVGAGIYHAASKIFSQNPKVQKIKVGKRTNPFTQVIDLTPTSATQGDIYSFDFGELGLSIFTLTRTVPGASSIAAECVAIKALIDGLALGVTVTTPGSAKVTVTANTPGKLFNVKNRTVNLKIFDATALPAGLSTDLDQIRAFDDDWYAVCLDSNSKAEVVSVAAWTETQFKIFGYHTADTDCSAGVGGNVALTLKASNYFRTFGLFDSKELLSYAAAGWIGEELPFIPGSSTWALKTIKAVTTDVVSASEQTQLVTANLNSYTAVAGLSVTWKGVSAAGEFIDIAVGRDWLQARLKERVFGALYGARKVPYTDGGIAIIKNEVNGQLQIAIRTGFLAADPAPVVIAPLAKDVPLVDKTNRVLNNVTFSATLAGAIHAVTINGTISA